MIDSRRYERPWMRPVLLLAGAYNLAWGLHCVVFPTRLFDWAGMEPPRYPELWQCIGMIVGVYGIGYLVAASDPIRHWPIVLVGFLGKIFGPIGFLGSLAKGSLPLAFGLTNLTNDVIWWVPFGAILWAAFKQNTTVPDAEIDADAPSALSTLPSGDGRSLAQLSQDRPVFAVLLRHAGCTFHREALADLNRARQPIEALGVQLAIVHMGEGENAVESARADYNLGDTPHLADPDRRLYQEVGLPRGKLGQLFGWKEITRGASACLLNGHGVGALKGDGFQLGGMALIQEGEIMWSRPLGSASERPDHVAEARSALAGSPKPAAP